MKISKTTALIYLWEIEMNDDDWEYCKEIRIELNYKLYFKYKEDYYHPRLHCGNDTVPLQCPPCSHQIIPFHWKSERHYWASVDGHVRWGIYWPVSCLLIIVIHLICAPVQVPPSSQMTDVFLPGHWSTGQQTEGVFVHWLTAIDPNVPRKPYSSQPCNVLNSIMYFDFFR